MSKSSTKVFLLGSDLENKDEIVKSIFEAKKNDVIRIVINSDGGSIIDMFALYDAIILAKNHDIKIQTVGIGEISSSSLIIFCAGSERYIGENATLMWHLGNTSIEGNIFNIESELNEFKRIEKIGNKILSNHSNLTIKKIESLIRNGRDYYFDASEAITYGIADYYLSELEL